MHEKSIDRQIQEMKDVIDTLLRTIEAPPTIDASAMASLLLDIFISTRLQSDHEGDQLMVLEMRRFAHRILTLADEPVSTLEMAASALADGQLTQ